MCIHINAHIKFFFPLFFNLKSNKEKREKRENRKNNITRTRNKKQINKNNGITFQ